MISKVDENFLQSLIDAEVLYQNAPCGYLSFLPDGTIIKVNNTLLQWTGYLADEIIFKQKFLSFLPKGVGIYYEMYYLPLIKMQGQVNEINYDIIRKDGSKFPALVNSTALKDNDGHLMAINTTVFDITDRKKYEQELLRAKQQADLEKKQLQFLADIIPDIVWTATLDGRLNYINRRFFEYSGIEKSHLSSNSVYRVLHPEDRRKCYHAWADALRTGKDFEAELRMKNASGVYEWFLFRAVPFKGSQEETTSKWFGACTNINEQIEDQYKKDLFISMASHELKTPLTGIKGYVQLLLGNFNEYDRSSIEKYLEKIHQFTGRLQKLISELLDVSLIQSGKIQYNMKAFDFAEMVNESIENSRNMSGQHEIITQLNITEMPFGDKERIAQVVENLLSNAIKYSPKADTVLVEAIQNSDEIKFSVTDFGIGIPQNQLTKVFDRYVRVNNDTKISGLGLGLYISSEIIKKHNGKLWVESELGQRSTFSFTLPLKE